MRGEVNLEETAAGVRTKVAYSNRWMTVFHNPRLIIIALFASYVASLARSGCLSARLHADPYLYARSFGGFEYGYQQGVLGQSFVMTRFVDNFPSVAESSSAKGWLTSVLQLGGILGSVTAGVFGEIFSRKYTMFSACLWTLLGSYMYIGAKYHQPELLYAGRFFTGLGVGTFSGVGCVERNKRLAI
jgi:MFS family permease